MDRSVKGFLTFAVANMVRIGESQLSCPCNICRNGHFMDPFTGTVLAHLLRYGFMDGYTRWTLHGEEEEDEASDGDGAPNGEETLSTMKNRRKEGMVNMRREEETMKRYPNMKGRIRIRIHRMLQRRRRRWLQC